jgi:hypothetical protein
MQKLLGVNTNYKTIKSEKVGVLTGIIYMSPYNLSGKNVCPGASKGCAAACLNTAGRGAMNVVQAARLKKTIVSLRIAAVPVGSGQRDRRAAP